MKILDIPQSGKRGLTVSLGGRFGQVSRALVIPTNPRTAAQLTVRDILATVARKWRGLTQAQRDAWTAAAKNYNSAARLGQSGPLTGSQLFVKVNANLAQFGQAQVEVPPGETIFGELAAQNLLITNVGGVVALGLTCPGDPGDNTVLRASAPQSQGRSVCNDLRILGTVPAPVEGKADITALYSAKFGVPGVGTKIFVRCNQMVNGIEDLGREFWAIVPAGA